MNTKIEVLLFDLGGVLIDFSGVRDIAPYLKSGATESEIRRRWTHCPHNQAFELGEISSQDFCGRFVQEWGVALAPEHFLGEFRSWCRSLLPGAEDLLASLRPRFRLVALSNSNELHWDRNIRDLRIDELFETAISSHQVGFRKPDPQIYQLALQRLGVPPDAVMFFDDLPENVAAASRVGMRAFVVQGVGGVRERLEIEGLM